MKLRISTLAVIGSAFLVSACAGIALQKDWKEKRGYTEEDISLTEPYQTQYNQMLASGRLSSNRFNSSEIVASQDRVRKIYCACVKTLGDKCHQSPKGLSASQKDLWAKGNAAEMALKSLAGGADVVSERAPAAVDDAECL